jgi:hypothetical protein
MLPIGAAQTPIYQHRQQSENLLPGLIRFSPLILFRRERSPPLPAVHPNRRWGTSGCRSLAQQFGDCGPVGWICQAGEPQL